MLKLRSIIPAAALVLLAACGGDDAAETQGEVDATAEPVPGAVVTPPVTVPPAGDTTMGAPTTGMDTTMGTAPAAGTTMDTTAQP